MDPVSSQTPTQSEQSQVPVVKQSPAVPAKVCPVCKYVVPSSWYFCPNCGKKLKMKPLSTSIWRQIGVYLISILFPPFGIIPAINYFRQPSWKARTVGCLCILFTVLSIYAAIWYANVLMKQINAEVSPQLNSLQELESVNQ